MKKVIKKINDIFIVFSAALVIWSMASFVEINIKKLMDNTAYSEYNFFVLLTENNKSY